eukprot:scaffold211432_cov41-Prasinocladus_malaysianus.AAC.1
MPASSSSYNDLLASLLRSVVGEVEMLAGQLRLPLPSILGFGRGRLAAKRARGGRVRKVQDLSRLALCKIFGSVASSKFQERHGDKKLATTVLLCAKVAEIAFRLVCWGGTAAETTRFLSCLAPLGLHPTGTHCAYYGTVRAPVLEWSARWSAAARSRLQRSNPQSYATLFVDSYSTVSVRKRRPRTSSRRTEGKTMYEFTQYSTRI